MNPIPFTVVLALASLLVGSDSLFGQSTVVTYQGRMNDAGNPATGAYDVRFALYGSAGGSDLVAGPLTNSAVAVSNGLFTISLDFGPAVFAMGADRWIQIGVRTNGGGAFADLTPRQRVTSAPYAIRSASATTAMGVSGSISATQLTGTIAPANIGVGTISSNMLGTGAVTSAALADGSVTASKIATVLSSNWVGLLIVNPTPATGDRFGQSVAAVGSDRVLVGASGDGTIATDPGAAYLFSPNGTLLTTFTNPTPATGDRFGQAVASAGDSQVLIGASGPGLPSGFAGKAYFFNTNGTLITTFTNPLGVVGNDYFGLAVAAVGTDKVLIGAANADTGGTNSGAAYLFSTNGTLLTTFTNPTPVNSYQLGYSVAAVGSDRVLIGGPGESTFAPGVGAAYLFSTNGTLLTTFTNPTPAAFDQFGWSVAAVGSDRVLIGAPQESTFAPDVGAAYLFSTNGTLLTTFPNPTPAAFDSFGRSVAAVGSDRVLIGAFGEDTGETNVGAAYLFSTNGTLLTTFPNPTPAPQDRFGWSVAAVGSDRVIIGADMENTGATDAGAAYLFTFTSGNSYVSDLISAGVADHSITAASLDYSLGVWSKLGANLSYNNGNVGIGTDTPVEKLSVAGNILATGTVSANTLAAGSITGNGAGLTGLNASSLASGTVSDARLAGNVARTNQVWLLGGNAGTSPGAQFLGTTDNQPLEIKVNGMRVARLESTGDSLEDADTVGDGAPNVILGAPVNFVIAGAVGATIAGGGATNYGGSPLINSIESSFGVIGGGSGNHILARSIGSSIAGGIGNQIGTNSASTTVGGGVGHSIGANTLSATIAGGATNSIDASYGTIAGGAGGNIGANAVWSTIGGGQNNNISAVSFHATIAGGFQNDIGASAGKSTIGGGDRNSIAGVSSGSTIGGGTLNSIDNHSSVSTIAGGTINAIGSNCVLSTISGGANHIIAPGSIYGTIAGGYKNQIGTNSDYCTIGGGRSNTVLSGSLLATIPGGDNNTATNYAFAAGHRAKATHTGAFVWADSTDTDFASTGTDQFLIRASGGVGIGLTNPLHLLHVGTTRGTNAFNASANVIAIEHAVEDGRATFLALAGIGGPDTTNRVEVQIEAVEGTRRGIIGTTSEHPVYLRVGNSDVMVLATNRFVGIGNFAPTERLHVSGNILATGTITPNSDRNAKTDVKPVDTSAILERVAKLPIQQWRFKAESEQVKHVGPMAQDFRAAFGLGAHETAIATVDADGVALAAIQGLNHKVDSESAKLREELKRRDAENVALKTRMENLERLLDTLTQATAAK